MSTELSQNSYISQRESFTQKCLLNTYCVPDSVLEARDTVVNSVEPHYRQIIYSTRVFHMAISATEEIK